MSEPKGKTTLEQKLQLYDHPPPNYPRQQHSTNGFSRCPSPAQLTSYLVVGFTVSVYYSCIYPLTPNPVLLALFSACLLGVIVSTLLATVCDPTDRMVYYYKWSKFDKKVVFAPDYSKVLFCEFCDSYCSVDSKHCRNCNRCVQEFDHHCMWFNNCVGSSNYRYFMVSVLSTFVMAVVVVVHAAVGSAGEKGERGVGRFVVGWVSAVVIGVFGFLLANLIALHSYLLATGQTTYQFLQRKKQEEQQQKAEKNKLSASKTRKETAQVHVHHELQSEQSMANTKIVAVGHSSQHVSSITKPSLSGRKVSNDYYEEEVSRDSPPKQPSSQAKEAHIQIEPVLREEHDATHIREDDSEGRIVTDVSGQKLPEFLRKNRSLKLILSASGASSPTKRRLEPLK